jgi:hypothetical protein
VASLGVVDGTFQTTSLGEGHRSAKGTISLGTADYEHVGLTGGESLACTVTDVDDVERTRVLFDGVDNTDAAPVASLGDHDDSVLFKVDDISDLASAEIDLNGVVHVDGRIRETDGATIVSYDVRDGFVGHRQLLDAAQFEVTLVNPLVLWGLEAVEVEATLGVKEEAEGITSSVQLDDVHETSRETTVSADLSVNFHMLLHADHLGLLVRKGIFEPVTQDD